MLEFIFWWLRCCWKWNKLLFWPDGVLDVLTECLWDLSDLIFLVMLSWLFLCASTPSWLHCCSLFAWVCLQQCQKRAFNMTAVAVNLRTSAKHESFQTCPTLEASACASAHGKCKLLLVWLGQVRLTPGREGKWSWVQRAAVQRQVLLGLQGNALRSDLSL